MLLAAERRPGSEQDFADSKDQLSVAALGRKMEPFDRSLDVHISNIRKKFPAKPDRIQTIRGRGYRLIASL